MKNFLYSTIFVLAISLNTYVKAEGNSHGGDEFRKPQDQIIPTHRLVYHRFSHFIFDHHPVCGNSIHLQPIKRRWRNIKHVSVFWFWKEYV